MKTVQIEETEDGEGLGKKAPKMMRVLVGKH
jgi:hypothetical protein